MNGGAHPKDRAAGDLHRHLEQVGKNVIHYYQSHIELSGAIFVNPKNQGAKNAFVNPISVLN
jgi:hypothetical protein